MSADPASLVLAYRNVLSVANDHITQLGTAQQDFFEGVDAGLCNVSLIGIVEMVGRFRRVKVIAKIRLTSSSVP